MKYTTEEIKRDLKIHTMLMVIVCILASVICFNAMKQAIDYEELKQEKEALEKYIELENERIGGNK